jgi:methyltransferase (TIGR00027 family)
MSKEDTPITHVTDTAFWVACYRAEESQRPDALFRDPQVSLLIDGTDEKKTAEMWGSTWVRWSVVMRTIIIDRFISELISQGVDTILNLGAGLDTRPYRMDLPANLKWIEVDFEKTIQFKTERLAQEKPMCQLERISFDLTDRAARRKLFSKIGSESKNVLIITEGVIPQRVRAFERTENAAHSSEGLRTHWN